MQDLKSYNAASSLTTQVTLNQENLKLVDVSVRGDKSTPTFRASSAHKACSLGAFMILDKYFTCLFKNSETERVRSSRDTKAC